MSPSIEALPRTISFPPSPKPMKRPTGLWVTLAVLTGFVISGMILCFWLRTCWVSHPDPRNWVNAFYVFFARNEPLGLAIVLMFSAATLIWMLSGAPALVCSTLVSPRLIILGLALITFIITTFGTFLVFHQYHLTADENMADFQAQIFLSGHLRAPVPAFWQPMIYSIAPTYAYYSPSLHSWASGYLPVYAGMRALLMAVGLQWLTNPICAAVSVLTIAAVARQLWPNDPSKPVLAAALLAASSQFLLMSMTSYAMPAHLALNLVWLWLYLDPAKRRFGLTPFVGVAALGLHQPFFHAVFVLPFLLKLVWDRRWRATIYFALIYSVGVVVWFAWWRNFLPGLLDDKGSPTAFGLNRYAWLIQVIYLCLMVGWLSFPAVILAPLGFSSLVRQSSTMRCVAASCLLTFGFYIFVRFDQSHGWGDRYFHGTLGCLILVAVAGYDSIKKQIGSRATTTFLLTGVAAGFLIQLPVRAGQAESIVAPYARANFVFHNADSDLVAFDPRDAWYSADLRRNDPFLRDRPIILTTFGIPKDHIGLLQNRYPNLIFINASQLQALGLSTRQYLRSTTVDVRELN